MKNKKTLLFSLGFLLLLIIVSGTSYQLLVNEEAKDNKAATSVKNDDKKDDKDDSKPVASYVVEETKPDTVEKINVNDVTTYSDPELGLSFSYPKSLKVKKDKSGTLDFMNLSNRNFNVSVYIYGNTKSNGTAAILRNGNEIVPINGREFVFPKDFYQNLSDASENFIPIGLVTEHLENDPIFSGGLSDPFTINGKTYSIIFKPISKGDNAETRQFMINLISSINF